MASTEPLTSRTRLMQIVSDELSNSLKQTEEDPNSDKSGAMKLIGLGIQSIPPEAIELIKDRVTRLSLQNNVLTTLPQYFQRLVKLRYLDIHDNKLHVFPEVLTKLHELEILDISFNELKELPNDLGYLAENLKILSIKNNQFDKIPVQLLSLENLKFLEIENNPLSSFYVACLNKIPYKPHSQEWLLEIQKFLASIEDETEDQFGEPLPQQQSFYQPPTLQLQHQNSSASASTSSATSASAHSHLERSRSTSESYVSTRAAKRMGFIVKRNQDSSSDIIKEHQSSIITSSPSLSTSDNNNNTPASHPPSTLDPSRNRSFSTSTITSPLDQQQHSHDHAAGHRDDHFYLSPHGHRHANASSPLGSDRSDNQDSNHHKSSDYFKRLSTLPESRADSLPDFKIIGIGRKILFAYTEFTSVLKKINHFNYDKTSQIEINSQLYSSKLAIDQLIENLERAEDSNKTVVSIDDILKSVIHTVHVFKKIMTTLETSYASLLKNSDVCFIRMFFLNLFMTYTEIFNAYKILVPDVKRKQPSKKETHKTLPPLKIPEQTNIPLPNINVTQQQLNEYSEIDEKLYDSLNNLLVHSGQVYSELNNAISKSAIANANHNTEEQHMTTNSINKIKDLTGTCVISMELNKKIKTKLLGPNLKSMSLTDKKKLYDEINSFLKSIITILGSTKSIMNESTILNEVLQSFATLTKSTKDVTVVLEMSSYRLINDSFNAAPPSSAIIPPPSANIQPMLSSIPSVMSIPQMNTPFVMLPSASASTNSGGHTTTQSSYPTPSVQNGLSNPFEASMVHNMESNE